MIRNGGKKMRAQKVVEFVKAYEGLEYAAGRAEHFASLAKKQLDQFQESASKTSLIAFADFVVNRNK